MVPPTSDVSTMIRSNQPDHNGKICKTEESAAQLLAPLCHFSDVTATSAAALLAVVPQKVSWTIASEQTANHAVLNFLN